MLRAVLNKSWGQRPIKQQLYSHIPPITKIIQVRRSRHAGHYWRNKDELISDYSCGPIYMDEQRQDDQLEPIYNSSVPILDVAWKTSREHWTIETGSEKGSGRSVLAAWHEDDDDDDFWSQKCCNFFAFLIYRILLVYYANNDISLTAH